MATVNPLTAFSITPKQFGNQLDLLWETPADRPENWKVYVFKRSDTDVTSAEIADYFAHINDLAHFDYNGLYVFDWFKPETDTSYIYSDFVVLNDKHYYYKAVIRNQTSGDYSAALSANAIPLATVTVKIQDGKELVASAVKKLFDSVKTKNGTKALLSKDFEVYKQFKIGRPKDNWFMIERINGATKYQYWGMQKGNVGSDVVYGSTDSDLIRLTFVTIDGNERRDLVASIFRAYKIHFERIIKAAGNYKVNNCQITVEGDYYNPQVHGENALGVTVICNLEIENEAKADELEVESHDVDNHKMVIGGQ